MIDRLHNSGQVVVNVRVQFTCVSVHLARIPVIIYIIVHLVGVHVARIPVIICVCVCCILFAKYLDFTCVKYFILRLKIFQSFLI